MTGIKEIPESWAAWRYILKKLRTFDSSNDVVILGKENFFLRCLHPKSDKTSIYFFRSKYQIPVYIFWELMFYVTLIFYVGRIWNSLEQTFYVTWTLHENVSNILELLTTYYSSKPCMKSFNHDDVWNLFNINNTHVRMTSFFCLY